jgi:hypothetical protein
VDARPGATAETVVEHAGGILHIPSDLVVDRKASAVRGSLILDFPYTPYSWPRNLPENNISNINMLKIYH